MKPLSILAIVAAFELSAAADDGVALYEDEIQPLLREYCVDCHGGGEPEAEIDFDDIDADRIDETFEIWEKTAARLIDRDMPPTGELQPTESERAQILEWYRDRFVESVDAKPAAFRPRRLCANEYRNTLRSVFGFDLEVAIIEAEQTEVEKSLVLKLLPEDPPGRSGFRNDTHGNPLSAVIWDQYSFLADHALDSLFDPDHPEHLERIIGPFDGEALEPDQAHTLIQKMLTRIQRRPIKPSELEPILARVDASPAETRADVVREELKTALMSPSFIYRGLLMPRESGQHPVDDYELAERISYFLWGDMPDDRLSELAAAGKLQDQSVLIAEVDRMLESKKARHLAEDFAVQWLALNEIKHTSNKYPLRTSLLAQSVEFMNYLFTEDRPLLELVDSKTTFINPLIAGFYPKDRQQMGVYRKPKGIEIEFVALKKIQLENTPGRGGILTMPGVLAMNKGPVLRGVWMLERILGVHLPDPPMDVGTVPPNRGGEKKTFRERFEVHRNNPTCASCHDKIDPLGFAMQRYNSAGGFLSNGINNKRKNKPTEYSTESSAIDTSGRLPSGESFEDADGLKQVLITVKRREIIRNIVRQTLSYALCRKLEIHDQPIVDKIVTNLDDENGTYRDLFVQIVTSLPFREATFE